MDSIRSILVILDPTTGEQQPALAKTVVLARALRASVELLVCETRATAEVREAQRLRSGKPCTPLEDWLAQLAKPLEAEGLDVTTAAIRGDPLHEALLEWIGKSPADLVVKDTHHHPLVRRTFLGNTDWHLIRACSQPLLLTKYPPWGSPPLIAAAIDPRSTEEAECALERRILECALMLGGALRAKAQVVHAYLPGLMARPASPAGASLAGASLAWSPELLATEQKLQEGRIRTVVERCGVGPLDITVEMGAAAEYLPRFAEQSHLDILVMGGTARSHLERALIGSTAERVLEHLPCDVLVVKSPRPGEGLPF